MCGGRVTRSGGCSVEGTASGQDNSTIDSPWVWVVLTIGLWLGLILLIFVMRICSHRQRRQRFLYKMVRPVCNKLGIKVNFTIPEEWSSGGRDNVFFIADLPPSYEMVTAYVNPACTEVQLPPPSYEEVTSMSLGACTTNSSEGNDVTDTSAEAQQVPDITITTSP